MINKQLGMPKQRLHFSTLQAIQCPTPKGDQGCKTCLDILRCEKMVHVLKQLGSAKDGCSTIGGTSAIVWCLYFLVFLVCALVTYCSNEIHNFIVVGVHRQAHLPVSRHPSIQAQGRIRHHDTVVSLYQLNGPGINCSWLNI